MDHELHIKNPPHRGHHIHKGPEKTMPHPDNAPRHDDGTIDVAALVASGDAEKIVKAYTNGERKLLDVKDVLLADGSGMTMIHYERTA